MKILDLYRALLTIGLVFSFDTSAESFRELSARRAAEAIAQGRPVVTGSDDWLFLTSELRHIGFGPFWGEYAVANTSVKPDAADPLPAIRDFNHQLNAQGIQLIVVPVPPKSFIYADKLTAEHASPAPEEYAAIEFMNRLSKDGVTVINLITLFRDERAKESDGGDLLYCREDSHWTSYAAMLVARHLVDSVGSQPWLNTIQKQQYELIVTNQDIRGDLRVLSDPVSTGVERVRLHRVVGAEGRPVAADRESPVLLLGDSHTLVFHAGADMHATGSGLADHLAVELGFPVDVLGVRGSGATPARISLMRRARSAPDYLPGKKLVIWCFGMREFTESSGWSIIPLTAEQR